MQKHKPIIFTSSKPNKQSSKRSKLLEEKRFCFYLPRAERSALRNAEDVELEAVRGPALPKSLQVGLMCADLKGNRLSQHFVGHHI